MKVSAFIQSLWTVLIFLLLVQCGNHSSQFLDEAKFKNPPADKKIHVWWHWLDGAISKDGISKDLEAMKQQGISQATILNIGLFNGKDFGVPRVKFNSEEWYGMFHWALKEANRLGIKIGVHNCDGWSSTGGPWITPEMSMKQYTWTKTIVSGGKDISIDLKVPQAIEKFYKDVAVIAMKTNETPSSFIRANPKINLNDSIDGSVLYDGCPVSSVNLTAGSKLNIAFPSPFTAQKISIYLKRSFMWGNPADYLSKFILYSSQDNINFRKIEEFEVKGLNHSETHSLPATTAKFFRLEVTGLSSKEKWIPVELAELELLREEEKPLFDPSIPNLSEKTGSCKATSSSSFYTQPQAMDKKTFAGEKEVINLTDKMTADGTLKWTAPEGNWTILRFGYTSTGARNGPATREGLGLECDKMDTVALNLHYRSFPKKLITAAGEYTGNTFKFFLIDSWECAYQNWTGNFPSEFLKNRGYDLIKFLPVLCGETIESNEISAGVLYDFRKTIADLIEQNYYKHYSELIHKDKLELHAEVIYGGTGYPSLDILKTSQYIDLPMYEFWAGQNPKTGFIEYPPSATPELNFPAVAAIDYNKPMMASEAYTGFAHYSESPADLKPYGDRAFCSGINQIILHSYVHQPLDKKPGMTLGHYASHFNRNNLYWQYISEWFNYQSRIEYILQQGITQPDVMYYLGDQLPQFYENNSSIALPFGYNLNACNFDILKNKLTIKNGQLILSGETRYGLLCLPSFPVMNLETLQCLDELVSQGAILYGPRPVMPLSRTDIITNKKAFEALVDKIWGKADSKQLIENKLGLGTVYYGMPLAEVIKKIKFLPDFETNRPDSGNFLFIHKKIGNCDAYFICNQQKQSLDRECIFKVNNKSPELWNPETGEIHTLAIFKNEDGRVRIPLHFGPRESHIIVFRDKPIENNLVNITMDSRQIFPLLKSDSSIMPIPLAYLGNRGIEINSMKTGDFTFTTQNKKTLKSKLQAPEEFEIKDFNGSINFEQFYDGSIASVKIKSLKSLTEFDDPAIKYFSGKAKYTIEFKVPSVFSTYADQLLLDLGNFESTAEVKLNGKKLGNVWNPGTKIDISRLIKEVNVLEVSVANVYRNRFIGDFIQYGKVQNLWTSSPIEQFLDKTKPLKPSGLMGPLKLIKLKGTLI
jgi:hypothetical protein